MPELDLGLKFCNIKLIYGQKSVSQNVRYITQFNARLLWC